MAKKAKAKVTPFPTKRRDQIRMALEEIRKKNHGKLTPRAVVAAARSPKHILHKEFVWDDPTAAAKQREDRAREIIVQYVSITVIHKAERITSPVYVRDPFAEADQAGYVGLTDEALNEAAAQRIVMRELDQIEWAIDRARGVTGVLDNRFAGLSLQFEALLQGLTGVRSRLAA